MNLDYIIKLIDMVVIQIRSKNVLYSNVLHLIHGILEIFFTSLVTWESLKPEILSMLLFFRKAELSPK